MAKATPTQRPAEPGSVLKSIWCIPALSAPVAAVIARYRVGARTWTHVLRWRLGETPEPGAWATLRLVRHRCFLDPTGEYLNYHGKRDGAAYDDPGPEHFRSSAAGGDAVSRLPWLSALTNVRRCGYGLPGGGPSKHALSAPERWVLWNLCGDTPNSDEPWFLRQQPGWRHLANDEITLPDDAPRKWWAIQDSLGLPYQLLVRFSSMRSTPSESLAKARFYLRTEGGELHLLHNIAWARLDASGVLRTASHDGQLSEWARGKRVKGPPPPIGPSVRGNLVADTPAPPALKGWKCRGTYDIASLEPRPGPAPPWAHASLPKAWLTKLLARATTRDREAIERDEVD